MSQRIMLLLAFVATLFLNAYSQKSELYWATTPIVIDGNDNDWNPDGQIFRFYDSNNKLYYDVRNDAVNLYLVIKSDNSFLQQQIMREGMMLKFSIKDAIKKTATFTIKPKKGMPEKFSPQKGQQTSLDELARKEEFFPKDTAFLQGFQFADNYVLEGNNNPSEITFEISKGRKATNTVFELLIPLRDFFGDNYNLSQINKTLVQLQLAIDAPSSESGQMRGGMRGGMGGPGGGDMGSGGMGGPGGGMGTPGGGNEMQGGNNSNRPEGMPQGGMSMEKKNMKFTFYLTDKGTR